MTDNMKDAWRAMMRQKYQTDDEGVSRIMAERQKKSMAVPDRKKGGFASMAPDRVKEISQQALNKRYHKDDENQNPPAVS